MSRWDKGAHQEQPAPVRRLTLARWTPHVIMGKRKPYCLACGLGAPQTDPGRLQGTSCQGPKKLRAAPLVQLTSGAWDEQI